MNERTIDKLKMLEATHPRKAQSSKRLKVFYGWSKLNKVQKKEGIAVFFENEHGAGSETSRSYKTMAKLLDVVAEREQTEKEMEDASFNNRVFSVYYVFMEDKAVKGSLERALEVNSQADSNHVPAEIRKEIADKLRKRYLERHPDYKEPDKHQELKLQKP